MLGAIPDEKKKAYAQLPLDKKWTLVMKAAEMRRETRSMLQVFPAPILISRSLLLPFVFMFTCTDSYNFFLVLLIFLNYFVVA